LGAWQASRRRAENSCRPGPAEPATHGRMRR
jgi:hypothetical protein